MLINYILFSLLKRIFTTVMELKQTIFGNPIFESKYENKKLKENVIALLPEVDYRR